MIARPASCNAAAKISAAEEDNASCTMISSSWYVGSVFGVR